MASDELLTKLVRLYRRTCGRKLEDYLEHFGSQRSLEDAIRKAYLTLDDKVHPHQCNVGAKVCSEVSKELIKAKNEIEGCRGFEQLRKLIEAKVRAQKIRRFGPLAVYDYALRIGSQPRPPLRPELVYLHRGAREGYKMLCPGRAGPVVAMEALPPPLSALEPYQAESFLCLCKGQFGR